MQIPKPYLVSLLAFSFIGCMPADPSSKSPPVESHPHKHDVASPETLAEAITLLTSTSATITDAAAGGNLDEAHDELHEVGHLIESLCGLASKEGLSSESQKSVAEASEKLMNAFGALDETMHGGKGKSYDDVELEIDWGINKLKSVLEPSK